MSIDQHFKLIATHQEPGDQKVLYEFLHKESGARHIHIEMPEKENVYMVMLKTVPEDHTGVAHILEHLTLCGSQRFPIRDPFFMMLRRSVNTYMNAHTANDHTAYYFASQNKKDYFNLMQVYNDAVFFPNLSDLDFSQEGHRIAPVKLDNKESGFEFKGVVFNEMKGALSDPSSYLWRTFNHHLYPDTTYGFNSGGDPLAITDLTHEALKAFYQKFYHPSNATFLSAGDLNLDEIQNNIHQQVLSHFDAQPHTIDVGHQKPFSAVKEVVTDIPFKRRYDEDDYLLKAWLLPESTDVQSWLMAKLVSSLLVGDSAAPLMQALETTELGRSPSSLIGLNTFFKQMSFTVGLEQSHESKLNDFDQLIQRVILDVIDKGFEQRRLEAVFNQFEFELKDRRSSPPYGIKLIYRSTPAILHQKPLQDFIFLNEPLETFRSRVFDGDLVTKWIQEWLVDNTHQILFCGRPNETLIEQAKQDELEKVAERVKDLSDEAQTALVNREAQLKTHQESHQDASILPTLNIDEINFDYQPLSYDNNINEPFDLELYVRPTNDIVAQHILFGLKPGLDEDLEHISLMMDLIFDLGCKTESYLERQEAYSFYTAGLSAQFEVINPVDSSEITLAYGVGTRSLARFAPNASSLISEALCTPKFNDPDRIKDLISQVSSSMMDSLAHRGHIYAMMAAKAQISSIGVCNERTNGLSFMHWLKKCDELMRSPKEVERIIQKFVNLHQSMNQIPSKGIVVTDQPDIQKEMAFEFVKGQNPLQTYSGPKMKREKIAWIGDLQVSYCALATRVENITHKNAPALTLISSILTNGFLHRVIREQGGAYGGGCSYQSKTGELCFYSYRDPNHLKTIEAFKEALIWLQQERDLDDLLFEAKMSVIGDFDKPESPIQAAYRVFYQNLMHLPEKMRIEFRSNILDVDIAEIKRVSKTIHLDDAAEAILTGEQSINALKDKGYTIRVI